ncbi:2704_t:CDS:2 [Entrophospora sp. SA101]|nr:2704_t:CDS:2 [Entrophospora sp. SA101]
MGNEQTKVAANFDTSQNGNLKPMQGIFKKGVQYNINRLQGEVFSKEYLSTPQIQVANIQWDYIHTNDVIKVEIWDVVDKGINSTVERSITSDTSLKIDNNQVSALSSSNSRVNLPPEQLTLDAATIDVYRNTHGIILMFDITKSWTFDYAIKKLESIPDSMTVLLLGNFSDLSEQRVITHSRIYQSLADINRYRVKNYPSANMIRYVETSMLTGLGLEYIYKYFGVPFLQLQRDILQQQLQLKTKELAKLLESLDDVEQFSPPSPTQNYSENIQIDDLENTNVIDEFVAGELEDDFFDDLPEPNLTLPSPPLPLPPINTSSKIEEDSPVPNPMVTGDEDLVGVEDDDESEELNQLQRQQFNHIKIISPTTYTENLTNVWHRRQSNIPSTIVNNQINDSSDDDNNDDSLITGIKQINLLNRRHSNAASSINDRRTSTSNDDLNTIEVENNQFTTSNRESSSYYSPYIDTSFDFNTDKYSPMPFGASADYEEIGEGQDNPWLDSNQGKNS